MFVGERTKQVGDTSIRDGQLNIRYMCIRDVCGLYECLINVHTGSSFFFKKYSCLSLPPVYSSTTVVSKFYFRVRCAKVWTYECHLYFDPHIFVFARVVNPVPCSTKWNLLVYQSLLVTSKQIGYFLCGCRYTYKLTPEFIFYWN